MLPFGEATTSHGGLAKTDGDDDIRNDSFTKSSSNADSNLNGYYAYVLISDRSKSTTGSCNDTLKQTQTTPTM